MSEQPRLFTAPPSWTELWRGMPEFVQGDERAHQKIVIHFADAGDVASFAEATGLRVTPNTDTLWYPPLERDRASDWVYVDAA